MLMFGLDTFLHSMVNDSIKQAVLYQGALDMITCAESASCSPLFSVERFCLVLSV